MACAVGTTVAQGLPQVVTLNSGVQFEGEVFAVSAVPAGERNAYGTKPIAVVNDGLRNIHFSYRLGERIVNTSDSNRNESEIDCWQRATNRSVADGYGILKYVGPFNKHGHRLLRYQDADGVWEVVQGITRVNPRWTELRSIVAPGNKRQRNWTMRIATRTIDPDILREFLRKQIKNVNNPAEYETLVDFFLQAEQYTRAMEELTVIQNQFPDQRDRVMENRQIVRQGYARQYLRLVRNYIDVGQPELAKQLIQAFNREGIAGEIVAEINELQRQLNNDPAYVEASTKMVDQIIAQAIDEGNLDQGQVKSLERFRAEIDDQCRATNVARLDAVRRFIDDNTMSAAQKASLALSGWILGSNNALDNLAVTASLVPVRDLVKEYLTTKDAARRGQILVELESFETGVPNYIAQMLTQMLPVEPPEQLDGYTGEQPIDYTVSVKGSLAYPEVRDYRCQVHLPPEYDPYRKYPCIITLPGDSNLDQQMARWCGLYNEKLGVRVGQAMRNGYIVVAVDWKLPNQGPYGYTKRAHSVVLKAYRAALRKFSIDTDRIFLSGHGVGGDAAYDIGLSHPEHWAGVIGLSGKIDRFADLYAANEHTRLPVYVVLGEKDLAAKEASKAALNKWLSSKKYAECVYVEYKGRVNEPFVEEIVEIFKWAKAQRRKLPDTSGFSIDVKGRRPWDNYFWFYEMKGFPRSATTWPQLWARRHPKPLLLSAELKGNQTNRFIIGPSNQGEGVTLWLSPEFVDFSKEIVITGRGRNVSRFIEPSAAVMLEDVRSRGDRQHPFWAKWECKGTAWDE
ncbi:MAG: esterase family protein [Mariniblastus sp.]|nr:esterase family protein [Mariniblastus sp.]